MYFEEWVFNNIVFRMFLEFKGKNNFIVGFYFFFIKNKMCFDIIYNFVIEIFLYLIFKIIKLFS